MTMASYSGKDARASLPDSLDISSLSVDTAPAQSSESVMMYPQPMEALESNTPPPFLTKTYDMVEDPSTNAIVSWSPGDNSFIVWDPSQFSQQLLPRYFKHSNFQSFVRQLNTYGFRKIDPDRWEFRNEGFLRGQKHLLKTIHRRKPVSSSQPQSSLSKAPQSNHCVEVGKFGLEGEIEQLKRDKNVLMMELVKLRQQQQTTERELMSMGQRLQTTEQRQQQMMTFLAKAIRSPNFLSQLMQQTESHHIRDARKKRRLPGQSEEVQINAFQPSVNGQLIKYDSGNMDILSSPLWSQAEVLSNQANTFSNEMFFEKPVDSGSQQGRVTVTEFPLLTEEVPGDTLNDLKNDSDFDFDLGDLDTDSTILDEFLSSTKEDAATDWDDSIENPERNTQGDVLSITKAIGSLEPEQII